MIGVRKNHGTSSAATMNSTSRKSTLSDATASASPDTTPTTRSARGIASSSVDRARGSAIALTTSRMASIAAKLTRCAPTTDSGTSCRGKRVFRMRFALSSIDRVDDWSAAAKNVHTAAREQKERIVAAGREPCLPDDAEHEQVHAHEHDRVHDRPEHAERRPAVLRLQVAAEEV